MKYQKVILNSLSIIRIAVQFQNFEHVFLEIAITCTYEPCPPNPSVNALQKILTASMYDDNEDFAGDGYVGLAINYAFLFGSIWLTVTMMTYIGIKNALIIGAIGDL